MKIKQIPFLTSSIVFLLLIQWACTPQTSQAPHSEAETAFTHVNVISMLSAQEGIQTEQTVRVIGEKIVEVGPSDQVKPSEHATIIDGSGKYLLPGLAEMHAHIPVPKEDSSIVEETLFLYLSNGITTIRGMLGDPFHLTLREQIASGVILGPRMYTSGPSLNGGSVPDPESAIQKVKAQKEAGYDFLKLHPGIKRAVFDSLVATAKAVDIPYAGHVSIDVGIRHAIASDYAAVDHLDGYLEGLVPKSAEIDPNENGFFGFNFTELVDLTKIAELSEATKDKNVWIVPTQSLLVRWTGIVPVAQTLSEPEMKYMSPITLDRWEASKNKMLEALGDEAELVEKFINIRQQIIQGLKAAGVDFLLGSDAPQIFNVPGFSIQHEMQSMVDAGLSPYEVLYSGTANPARFFGDMGKYGTIVSGSSADLILVNANPLDDISNMRNQEGVMLRGTWLSKVMIQDRLAKIARKYADLAKN